MALNRSHARRIAGRSAGRRHGPERSISWGRSRPGRVNHVEHQMSLFERAVPEGNRRPLTFYISIYFRPPVLLHSRDAQDFGEAQLPSPAIRADRKTPSPLAELDRRIRLAHRGLGSEAGCCSRNSSIAPRARLTCCPPPPEAALAVPRPPPAAAPMAAPLPPPAMAPMTDPSPAPPATLRAVRPPCPCPCS